MDEILGQVLRNAVWERLDMLAELANRADAPSLLSVARSELPRLTEGWRAMLAAHEPDEKGNCPACSSRWRQQKAPCSVWQAAYEHRETPLPVDHVAAVDAPDLSSEGGTMQLRAALRVLSHRARWRRADEFHSLGFPPCSYAYNQLHWCLRTQNGP